ncbi:DUF2591 domain-containing protein [Proteus sp. G2658]|uniref:DUF2591 family protein n=1 Tax=Proteus sp. G2658 TaxID=2698871 RepID=UPI001378254A|nr:DUF2591 family protein [Proteus sp. G2658]NBM88905.1 DUF2591 domain-containing protein [Proteus sp. G2658]
MSNYYANFTDLQINSLVVTNLKMKSLLTEESILAYMESGYKTFDPCNNPADAMPIIIKNNIDLLNGVNENLELCEHHSAYTLYDFKKPIVSDSLKSSKTIYRLAMEVYLMIKDAEREANT